MSSKEIGEDFLSIKEFAELVGMTVVALQHYDKTGIFLPAKRGIEFENKYRYYSPTQITSAKMIRVLTEIGVPLKIVKELTQHRTPEKTIKLLSRNKDKVADEVRFLQDVYSVISTFIELLNEGMSVTESEISVTEMPGKQMILGGLTEFCDTEAFYQTHARQI